MPKKHLYWLFSMVILTVLSVWCTDPFASSFSYIVHKVRKNTIRKISERELFDAGVEGLLARIDKNSSYIPPTQYEEINEEFTQVIGSVGIKYFKTRDPYKVWIGCTLPRSAARLADVRPGDEILSINGAELKDIPYEEIERRLRVPVGMEIALELFRPSVQKKLAFSLISKKQFVPSTEGVVRLADGTWSWLLPQVDLNELTNEKERTAKGKKTSPKLFYVHLKTFGEKTYNDMKDALERANTSNAEGLILDLTGNTGGLVDSATDVCGLFIPDANVNPCVKVKGKENYSVFSTKKQIWKKPIVVLIDGQTASAAELLAACLQDYNKNKLIKAVCVGEKTYGKGTIQDIFDLGPLPDDRYLENENDTNTLWKRIWEKPVRGGFRFSVAEYLSPNGSKIDEKGVSPDIVLKKSAGSATDRKANQKRDFREKRQTFDELRLAGALPQERWNEIYKYNVLLKQAVLIFDSTY